MFRQEELEVGVTFLTLRGLKLFSSSYVLVSSPASNRSHVARIYLATPPKTTKRFFSYPKCDFQGK
jgi:hypothetical protein